MDTCFKTPQGEKRTEALCIQALCKRLNKSESLLLLLIMKMNRHLLHGACTSQNKLSNINKHTLISVDHSQQPAS